AEEQENRQREADASVDVRLAMMRTDGIHGEMVYPTIGLYVYGVKDPAVGVASCRVYNDWIHEKLGDDCGRVRYAALVPAWDAEPAGAEIGREAAWPGLAAPMQAR